MFERLLLLATNAASPYLKTEEDEWHTKAAVVAVKAVSVIDCTRRQTDHPKTDQEDGVRL